MIRSLRFAAVPALALALVLGAQACATGGNCPTSGESRRLLDHEVLMSGYRADGATTENREGTIVVRYEDLGVIATVRVNDEKALLIMSTIWGKKADVIPDADWLLKINGQNRDGIVKVYLDNDADVVTEWLLEVRDGLGLQQVAEATRVFAARSRQVALELAGYIQ